MRLPSVLCIANSAQLCITCCSPFTLRATSSAPSRHKGDLTATQLNDASFKKLRSEFVAVIYGLIARRSHKFGVKSSCSTRVFMLVFCQHVRKHGLDGFEVSDFYRGRGPIRNCLKNLTYFRKIGRVLCCAVLYLHQKRGRRESRPGDEKRRNAKGCRIQPEWARPRRCGH